MRIGRSGVRHRLVLQVAALCLAGSMPLPLMADIDASGAACTSVVDCEDMNPCTLDTCLEGYCVNTRNAGLTGIECELDRLEDVDICGAELPHEKFSRALAKKVSKARSLGQKATEATKEKRVAKLIVKANKKLQSIAKKAAKFTRRNKMTEACRATVEQRVVTIQQLFEDLAP